MSHDRLVSSSLKYRSMIIAVMTNGDATICEGADCLQFFLNNWSKLFQICEEYRVVIESPILLLRLAEQLFSRLKPIAIALDKANISTVVRIRAELEVALNKNSEFKLDKGQRKKVIERKKKAITKYQ